MKPYLKAQDIPEEIKEKLPTISKERFDNRYCEHCMYYAGKVEGIHHCMIRVCAWDSSEERFDPRLKKLITIYENKYKEAELAMLEAENGLNMMKVIFRQEMKARARKRDICNKCPYNKQAPCVGFCYAQMSSNPTDEKGET